MSRYIDADALKEKIERTYINGIKLSSVNAVIVKIVNDLISDAPTIDIARCGECIRRKKNKFCLELNRYAKDDNGHCSWGVKETDHE